MSKFPLKPNPPYGPDPYIIPQQKQKGNKMKTPEEMAEEYLDQDKVASAAINRDAEDLVKDAFIAGYKAAMKKYDIALIEEKIKRESKEVLMSLLQQRAKEIAEDK